MYFSTSDKPISMNEVFPTHAVGVAIPYKNIMNKLRIKSILHTEQPKMKLPRDVATAVTWKHLSDRGDHF